MSLSHRALATSEAVWAQCPLTRSPGVRCFLRHFGVAGFRVKWALCHEAVGTGTMVDILKQVGTADWDRGILNMSVNTPASWSADALRTWLGMPPAALRGLTRRPGTTIQSLGAGRVGGTVLSSKRAKKVFLACPGAKHLCLRCGWFFPFVIRVCL